MTVLLRKECHFVMLGWDRCPGKLSDEPGAGQPGHAWDSRHSGNVESGDWSIKNVASWLMAPRNSCHSWIMQRTNQNPENVSASEKSLNKSPEVTGKWCCSKYADCRGYERLAAFFSTVLVCLDTISHAACGAISYQLAGPRHKTQKSISPVDTGAVTPHSSHPHCIVTSLTQEASCQAPSLSAAMFTLALVFP